MKIMPLGDYYVWYCEWCDTKNLTLWTRFEKGQVFCGACHNGFPMPHNALPEGARLLAGMI
jgi:hypothetical protein